MDSNWQRVRSLEQQESGEMRSLRCASCGAHSFRSVEQLARHESACRPARAPGNLTPGN